MNIHSGGVSFSDDIQVILGLHEMTEEEKNSFLQKIGEIVIESATLRFVTALTEEEKNSFEAWLSVHQDSETLLQLSCEKYPQFADLLSEEITDFHNETRRLFHVKSTA